MALLIAFPRIVQIDDGRSTRLDEAALQLLDSHRGPAQAGGYR